jgi:pimeloyl-ACP methyl ester carboxylesterase
MTETIKGARGNTRMILVLILAVCGTTSTSFAESAPMPEQGLAPYLTPQRVAHLETGRTINFVCLGHGSPTVVLSAGLGDWSWWWWWVQGPLAKRTRVCAWDRAGYGFSAPSSEPQDIVHTTGDLERALKRADIRRPYVMVGHSMGAYEVLRFTDLHRRDVLGMVLVDPDIPGRPAVEERLAPQFAAVSQSLGDQVVKQRQDCIAALRRGTLTSGSPRFEQCTDSSVPAAFPDLKAAIARLNADPARLQTQSSLENEHYNSSRQVTNAQRHYGDLPLVVLTAGGDEASTLGSLRALPRGTPGVGTPEELAQLREQIARFLREGWGPAHEGYAALSVHGRHQLVPDSGHNIMVEKPEVVIAAITEVLNECQAKRSGIRGGWSSVPDL